MNLADYLVGKKLGRSGITTDALLAALMTQTDSRTIQKLAVAFPQQLAVFKRRSDAPQGVLAEDGVDVNDGPLVRRMAIAADREGREALRVKF